MLRKKEVLNVKNKTYNRNMTSAIFINVIVVILNLCEPKENWFQIKEN